MLTREDALAKLQALANERDIERSHAEADHVLRDLLRTLGYGDVADAWNDLKKWYS